MNTPLLQFAGLVLGLLISAGLRSQDLPSLEEIDVRVRTVEASTELDDEVRRAVLEQLRTARSAIEVTQQYRDRGTQFDQARVEAPERLSDIRSRLARPPVAEPGPGEGIELDELRASLTGFEAMLATEKRAVADLEAETSTRIERRAALPSEIATARAELRAAESQPDPVGDAQFVEASRLARRARIASANARITAGEAELASYEARGELLIARRELAELMQSKSARMVETWRAEIDRRARLAAADASQQASGAVADATALHPALGRLARENAEIAHDVEETLIATTATRIDTLEAEKVRRELDREFAAAQDKVEKVGLIDAIGLQLRQSRGRLDASKFARREIARRTIIEEVQLDLIDTNSRRAVLDNPSRSAEELVAELAVDGELTNRQQVVDEATKLLTAQRQHLDDLLAASDRRFDELIAAATAERLVIDQTRGFARFIDERVLWIRSVSPAWRADWRDFIRASNWLFGGNARSGEVRRDLLRDLSGVPVWWGGVFLVVCVLLLRRRAYRRMAAESGIKAAKPSTTAFRPTAMALLWTILAALPFALALAFFAKRFMAVESDWLRALGAGMWSASIWTFALAFLRRAFAPGQLALAHFGWEETRARRMRRSAQWLPWVIVPGVTVLCAVEAHGVADHSGTLGRAALIANLAALGVALHRILQPHGGVLDPVRARVNEHFFQRTRSFWYLLAIAVPAALIVLAAMGYMFTAVALFERLELTLSMTLLLVFLMSLVVRALQLQQRKLAIQRAREARVAAQESGGGSSTESPPIASEASIDLVTVDTQTRQLVRAGFAFALLIGAWAVWIDVLPALEVLREFVVWPGDGTSRSLTLSDLLTAALIVLFTVLATRNLPGLLEVTVLARMTLGNGERYAIATLFRYVLFVVGVFAAFQALGIGWAKVQWLAAAITVGLGFGLQEIFANFFSGLIILFERPVRVGDIVTIGDAEGRVARIRMRATTIVDWDRRELVVPNKEIVTGRIVNWTLTDPVTRVILPVGIAYGSDVELARKVLVQAATDCPFVLAEPKARAVFSGFGDSALELRLYVYMADREFFLDMRNWLHLRIDDDFRKSKIEIAFPQRDIHVRTFTSAGAALIDPPELQVANAQPGSR